MRRRRLRVGIAIALGLAAPALFVPDSAAAPVNPPRNAPFVAAGEPPWKDEVFRPKWGLLGAAGAIAGAVVSGFGASWPILIGVASVPALVLALLGVVYLRR